jgi:hypothetical protein
VKERWQASSVHLASGKPSGLSQNPSNSDDSGESLQENGVFLKAANPPEPSIL